MGGLFPAFGGIKEVSVLALVVSQVTLIQNNHYVNGAYFGVTYSEPLHHQSE